MPPTPLRTVVLIDDNALDNRMHARVLDRAGAAQEILSFTLAEEALAHFRAPGALPVDMVLLDINMPRMDGFEFLEAAIAEFGAAFERCPVIMLSTSLNPRDRARAARFDVIHAYAEKPLSAAVLTETLASLAQKTRKTACGRVTPDVPRSADAAPLSAWGSGGPKPSPVPKGHGPDPRPGPDRI